MAAESVDVEAEASAVVKVVELQSKKPSKAVCQEDTESNARTRRRRKMRKEVLRAGQAK